MERIDAIIARWMNSKKYRHLDVCEETMRHVLSVQLERCRDVSLAEKEARRKLHHIVAGYLGDLDYGAAERRLAEVAASDDHDAIRAACVECARAHATTRERTAVIGEYYERIFAVIGRPSTVLDLACGLNPVFIPWMHLKGGARYYAYDIRRRRIEFLNAFFTVVDLPELAELRDVLARPPKVEGNVALLLQEAHRIEQREPGATRRLLDALRTPLIVVSFPSVSLSGRHDLREAHRDMFARIVWRSGWRVAQLEIGRELVFCIEKTRLLGG